MCFPGIKAYAGDLNGAEAGIISYVSGAVFEYNGVSYVAKQEYIQQLRAKLMEDGVDLTDKEAKNAIMQINANVKTGVTDGYLVALSDTPQVTETPSQVPTQPATEEDKTGTEESEKDTGETDTKEDEKDNGETGTKEDEKDTGETGTKEDEKNTGGTNLEENKNNTEDKKDGSEDNNSGENEINIQKPEDNKEFEETDKGQQSVGNKPQEEPRETIEIETFLKDVLNQNVETVNVTSSKEKKEDNKSNYCVEEYVPAKLTVVSENGEVLLKGKLPIKNTGYGNNIGYFVVAGIGYCLALIAMTKKKRLGVRKK